MVYAEAELDSTVAVALSLLVSPAVILAVHVAIARSSLVASAQVGCVTASVVALGPTLMLVLVGWLTGDRPATMTHRVSAAVYTLVVYAALAYSYFHLFNLSETARRIRILYEIYRVGQLSAAEVLATYGTSDIVQVRLHRLTLARQLTVSNGRYVVSGRLLYYAGIMVEAWRSLLGFGPIGRRSIRVASRTDREAGLQL